MLVIGGKLRAVLFERIEREDHVVGRHRRTVMELRLRPQAVGDRGEIVGIADAFGQQAISRRHLIQGGDRQRVVDEIGTDGYRAFDPRDHQVEIVEGADRELTNAPALGSFRIDVVEMLEIRLVFEVAEEREAMSPFPFGGTGRHGRHHGDHDQKRCSAYALKTSGVQLTLLIQRRRHAAVGGCRSGTTIL